MRSFLFLFENCERYVTVIYKTFHLFPLKSQPLQSAKNDPRFASNLS